MERAESSVEEMVSIRETRSRPILGVFIEPHVACDAPFRSSIEPFRHIHLRRQPLWHESVSKVALQVLLFMQLRCHYDHW